MKGTLKVKDDTVTIEEFSYPLEQFLIDEPDFKAPKADELVYRRGEGTLLYIGEDTKKDEKNYPTDMMEIFIARKKSYRGAFKARRNATAQGRNWRDEIEQDTPKKEEADPAEENVGENEGNTGDDGKPDETGNDAGNENGAENTDQGQGDNAGEGVDENQGDENKSDEAQTPPKDEDQKPAKNAGKPDEKADAKDKKAKSGKQKENKDGNN